MLGFRAWPTPIRQLRDALRSHQWRQDILLAFGVLLLGIVNVRQLAVVPHVGARVPLGFVLAAAVLQSVPLLWRRSAPLPVFAVILAVCAVEWSFGAIQRTDVSLLIGLYSLARYGDQRRLRSAGWATFAALLVAVLRIPELQDQPTFGLFFLGTPVAASIVLGLAARDRQAQLSALAERAERLEREREQRTRLATLAERARVSREMHDIIGHTLAVIIGLADGGASQVTSKPEHGKEALQMIAESGRQALSELRRTLGALQERPLEDDGADEVDLNPQPSAADLAQLLERTRAAGPQVTYRTVGDLSALPRGVQLAVYRIVQESLTNSLKHAGPHTSVNVVIETDGQAVRLTVSDTGRPDGPPPAPSDDTQGRGLAGIRERAALAGGRADAAPNNAGWTVRAVLPLTPHEERPA